MKVKKEKKILACCYILLIKIAFIVKDITIQYVINPEKCVHVYPHTYAVRQQLMLYRNFFSNKIIKLNFKHPFLYFPDLELPQRLFPFKKTGNK